MDEIITRAIHSITDILESSELIKNLEKSELIDTRKQLHRSIDVKLTKRDSF
jgi:hypothetical protein